MAMGQVREGGATRRFLILSLIRPYFLSPANASSSVHFPLPRRTKSCQGHFTDDAAASLQLISLWFTRYYLLQWPTKIPWYGLVPRAKILSIFPGPRGSETSDCPPKLLRHSPGPGSSYL